MNGKSNSGQSVTGRGASLSTPGLLATMTSLTLLYGYWAFGWYLSMPGSTVGHVIVITCGSLVAIWGINEMLISLMGVKGTRRFSRSASSGQRLLRLLPGLGLMGGSLAVGFLIAIRAEMVLTVILAMAGSVLFFVIGLRKFVEGLQPRQRTTAVRRRQRLPVTGMFYLLIMSVFLIGSLIGRSNMLMLMFSMMAGPFVLNGWITRRMLTMITCRRTLPQSVMAGDTIDVDITVKNGRSLLSSWLIDVEDTIRGRNEQLPAVVLFVRIPPQRTRSATYRLRLMQRGRYEIGPLALSTRFPLGIAERGLETDLSDEIIVHPLIGRLTDAWRRDCLAAAELVQRERPETGIYDDEFHRMREFRWGDNPRAIHWRTSARRNELMVREYHQSRDRDLCVLLDLWLPDTPTEADRDRVELAVSFVATLCVEHMQQSRDAVVTLVASGQTTARWQGQAAAASFDSLLTALALMEGGRSSGTVELLEHAALARTTGLQTVLVTTHEKRTSTSGNGGAVAIASHVDLQSVVADPETLSRYLELPELGTGAPV